MIKISKISLTEERRIIENLLFSKKLLADVIDIIKPEYFRNEKYIKIVKFIIAYYDEYEDAPKEHIQDFIVELKENDRDYYIDILNPMIERNQSSSTNDQYFFEQTLKFFKKRELEIISDNVKYLIGKNDIQSAEKELLTYNEPTKLTTQFFSPFDNIQEVFDAKEDGLFTFNHGLGELIGPINRGWFIAIAGGFKRGKCVSGDTLIQMSDGTIKTIKYIVENKLTNIISLSANLQFEHDKIIEWYEKEEKELYELTTKSGRKVKLTKEHQVLTINGWKKLEKLFTGNRIAVPKELNTFGIISYPQHKISLLAFLLADGGITQRYFTFTKKDKELKAYFRKSIEAMGDRYTILREITDGIASDIFKENQTTKWFNELGLTGCKSKDKFIPDIVFQFDKQSTMHFLSILFSCDGSIYRTKKRYEISYTSASEKMIQQIGCLLSRFGILFTIRERKIKCNNKYFAAYQLDIRGNESVIIFEKEIGFRFSKKQDKILPLNRVNSLLDQFNVPIKKLKEIFPQLHGPIRKLTNAAIKKYGTLSRKTIKNISEQTNDSFFQKLSESEVYYDEIKSIEYVGKEKTYDITVEKNHNFIGNNIVLHNSFFLMEFFIAAMLHRLKVVHFSLEMQQNDMKNRLYRRVLSLADIQGLYRIPIFDCLKNQNGKCTYPTRVGSGLLFDKNGKIPNPKLARNHKICTVCMGSDDFEPSSWYEDIPKDEYEASNVIDKITGFKKLYSQFVQMRCFPRFSASVKDIKHEVDILINKMNFLPDVIIVDFADILRADSNISGFEKEDLIWMELAQLASTLNCVVVTATQLTRDGLDTENIEEKHLSKWIGKLSHVDIMMALNQTDEEKAKNIMRITMLDHRHKDFNKLDTCYLLQDLAIGQANLGSYLKRFK